jgi:hypothetical protein
MSQSERKYWPLDYEPEPELFDLPGWELPGLRRRASSFSPKAPSRPSGRWPGGARH